MSSSGRPKVIVIMGPTGSGKSSFLNRLAGERKFAVGDNLTSETNQIQVHDIQRGQDLVRLVDTPGFDDTKLTEFEVLKKVADYLKDSYEAGFRITGAIYLHRISDVRVGGTGKAHLALFQRICGPGALSNAVLCSTRWDVTTKPEAEKNEAELKNTFWSDLIKNGAVTRRHHNSPATAEAVLNIFLPKREVTLQIQDELVTKNLSLKDTAAGQGVATDMAEMEKKYSEEFKRLAEERRAALAEKDQEMADLISQQQNSLKSKLIKLAVDGVALGVKTAASEYQAKKQAEREVDTFLGRMFGVGAVGAVGSLLPLI